VRILPRSVENVSKAVTALINNKKLSQDTIDELMTPHFNGWKGTVIKGDSSTQWELIGTFQRINSTKIIIDELPVGYEADKFKSILIDLMDKGFVRDFDNNSSEEGFNFEVTVPREVTRKADEEILKLFKLKLKVGENVTLWDTEGKLKRYDDVFHALQEFVEFRVGVYGKRKEAQLASMDDDLYFMENKIKFITYWNNDLKDPHKKKKHELSKELVGAGVDEKFIDRLLSMQINSLTMELVDELEKAYQKLLKERQVLEGKTETKLFQEDLKDLYRNDLK
jgi:DNA gyrase/topoisomerase IV subunit A